MNPPSTPPSVRRQFLGWHQPVLSEAIRELVKTYRNGTALDLSGVIVVVPGQRAGRRLLELLVFAADEQGLLLTLPEVTTEGRLPEMLYRPRQPFADELVQQLAWAQALREMPQERRCNVIPHAPRLDDDLRWLELADLLRRLHVELAADGRDFDAVRRSGFRLDGFAETERWTALAEVQERYLKILDKQGLWDIQTARLKAIELNEVRSDHDIFLLGTVDLNTTLRTMLERIADRVTAFVAAPESTANRFDSLGCLISDQWCDVEIPLDEAHLRHVDGPVEQADTVTGWLKEIESRFRTDEISIGVPDESIVPQLQRQLEQCGVKARWVEGTRIGATAPYRLLAAAVRFAGLRRYDDLAALVRHPDLDDWLQGTRSKRSTRKHDSSTSAASLPAQLDCYYNAHLPSRIRADLLRANDRDWPNLPWAVESIERWLQGMTANHSLREWGDLFCQVLGTVYSDRTLELDNVEDDFLHRTFRRILETCEELNAVPKAFDTLSLSAAEAFEIVLEPLAQETSPPAANPDAIEILGWLELPLDDAPALIVTSFNDGFVPQSAGADAFLPDGLRRELRLLHNERRYARDAYATCVLAHSRSELRVIVARRDSENNPLRPSRLLFACKDDILISRANRLFGGSSAPPSPRTSLLSTGKPIPATSSFTVPVPVPDSTPRNRISVSEFKSYLACPYRYYLRYVRRLKAIDDDARELDGGSFGTLMHKVLGDFGRESSIRHSDRSKTIVVWITSPARFTARINVARRSACNSNRHAGVCSRSPPNKSNLFAMAGASSMRKTTTKIASRSASPSMTFRLILSDASIASIYTNRHGPFASLTTRPPTDRCNPIGLTARTTNGLIYNSRCIAISGIWRRPVFQAITPSNWVISTFRKPSTIPAWR